LPNSPTLWVRVEITQIRVSSGSGCYSVQGVPEFRAHFQQLRHFIYCYLSFHIFRPELEYYVLIHVSYKSLVFDFSFGLATAAETATKCRVSQPPSCGQCGRCRPCTHSRNNVHCVQSTTYRIYWYTRNDFRYFLS